MTKAYPSNLTRTQFELLNDLIPEPKTGGRPRQVEMWAVLNAIFYVLVEGVRWRSLPGDFPPWQTVYGYFRAWRLDGTWIKIHDHLREWVRIELFLANPVPPRRCSTVKASKVQLKSAKPWGLMAAS